MKRVFITVFLLLFSGSLLFAQKYGRERLDSLTAVLHQAKEDTNMVLLLCRISDCLWYSFDSSLDYAQKSLSLSTKLHWGKGIDMSVREIGDAYFDNNNYAKALEYYFKSLKYCEDADDKKNEAAVLRQLIYLYSSSGDYAKSLEYASRLLKLNQAVGNKNEICNGLSILREVYENMRNFPKALEYTFEALDIYKKMGAEDGIQSTYREIGRIYSEEDSFARALEYASMSLKISESTRNADNIKTVLADIGNIYTRQQKYADALAYYNRIIKTDEDAGNKKMVTNDYYAIVEIYLKQRNYHEALAYGFKILKNYEETDTVNIKYALGEIGMTYFNIAVDTAGPIKADDLVPNGKTASLVKARDYFIKSGIQPTLYVFLINRSFTNKADYYPALIETQALLGDYKEAFQNLKVSRALDDAASSKKSKEIVSNLEIKQASDDLEKQAAIDKITESKKRNERMFYTVGISLLLLVVAVIYRNFRTEKKSNVQLAESNKIITKEKKRSDDLLLNILPAEVAEELKEKGSAEARYFDHVTVLFTDFVGFTKAGERMSPQQLVDELDACFKKFDEITGKYGIEKIKTIGDSYMAVAGLPIANPGHAENVVKAAMEIADFMAHRKQQLGDKTFNIRIGIHSGSVVAGIVGIKKFAYDIWGDTVNTAARMEQNSEPGKINISETTWELIKDKIPCTYRGEIEAKGKGMLKMYYVG